MTQIRTLRRAYYNLFSHLYDAFIALHARRDAGDTRLFLARMAHLAGKPDQYIFGIAGVMPVFNSPGEANPPDCG